MATDESGDTRRRGVFRLGRGALLLVYANTWRRGAAAPATFGLTTGETLRLFVFAWLALRWIRAIVWWGLVLPAPLAGLLQRAVVGARAGRPRGGRR